MSTKPNPFSMPRDDSLFRIREEERKRKKIEKDKLRTMTFLDRTRLDFEQRSTHMRNVLGETLKKEEPKMSATDTAIAELARVRRHRESCQELLQRKREMFLLQMSHATKAGEIQRLKDAAAARELKLQQTEETLDSDAAKFNRQLKEKDIEANDAV
ncbi:hypothetical protein ADUPG1_008686, partial [Aduncisulcus paluster]